MTKDNLLYDIDDIIESSRDSASEGTDSRNVTSRSIESKSSTLDRLLEAKPAPTTGDEKPLNHHEKWQAELHERIESLKKQEVEETKTRTKQGAEELEKWHVDRNKKIQETLQKLLSNEPNEVKRDMKDPFDWAKCAKYVEESDYFPVDQSHGSSQKLIELIMKRKAIYQNAK